MRKQVVLCSIHEEDYPKLIKLWEASGSIDVRQTDTPEVLGRFLPRNPICSYGAYAGSRLVGAVLACHDGWRGYLYHTAVKPDYREKGIGSRLVSAAVSAMQLEDIQKIHCLVKRENLIAQQFW